MTLVVGCIYRREVHLFVDSAVTTTNISNYEVRKDKSSFGEVTFSEDGRIVEESANKLCSIDERILIAFAGNEASGLKIQDDLNRSLTGVDSSNITEILTEYFEVNIPPNNSFLIGFSNNGIGNLFSYKGNGEIVIFSEEGDIALLGSGVTMSKLIGPLKASIEGYRQENPSSKDFNVVIQSILQCAALNGMTFSSGVGGFFNGAYIGKQGLNRSADIIYILCLSRAFKKFPLKFIFKYDIMDAVAMTSEAGNYLYYPGLPLSEKKIETIRKTAKQEILDKVKNCQSDYIVVLALDRLSLFIIKRYVKSEDKYIILRRSDDGRLEYGIDPKVYNNMSKEIVDPRTGYVDNGLVIMCRYGEQEN